MSSGGPVLRDIHLPSAAWWPPAPGWWLLAGLVVLVAAVAWLAWRRPRRHALRAAMHEIDALEAAYARNGDAGQLVDGASRLLRRVARLVDPAAASWSGNAWHSFLHVYARGAATKETLDQLVEARFRERPVMDTSALLAALRAWCGNALRGNERRKANHFGEQTSPPRGVAATSFVQKGVIARVRGANEEGAP